jgi:hypothetical protein
LATNANAQYQVNASVKDLRDAGGGNISFRCVLSGHCIRGGDGSTPKSGDVVEMWIGGSWWCCIELVSVPESSEGQSDGNYSGQVVEGSELEQVLAGL